MVRRLRDRWWTIGEPLNGESRSTQNIWKCGNEVSYIFPSLLWPVGDIQSDAEAICAAYTHKLVATTLDLSAK